MLKTLRISFALKNTYRVNGILHSLKQIPLLKRVLPDRLYQVRGLKIFANVLSVLWEIVSIFLGKLLYFLTMVCGVGLLYERAPAGLGFLHILLFLTLIGSYMNTSLFNPTRDKYYAMILLRMNARSYTLAKLRLRPGEGRGGVPALHHPLWPGPGRAAVAVPADPLSASPA